MSRPAAKTVPYALRLSRATARRAYLRRNLGLRRRYPTDWPRLPRRGGLADQQRWIDNSQHRWRAWAASAADDGETISVVCATCRPSNLARIVENFDRQEYRSKRLVVVPNNATFAASQLRWLQDRGVVVPEVRHGGTLGEHLNRGLDVAGGGLVAKFDDDDDYGPAYLSHLRHALRQSGAAVAGKHTTFGYLADADTTVMRFPGHEMEYTLTLAGGTLLIDGDECRGVEFPPLSVGEDGGFLAAVERAGGLVFAADRFSYVQRRTGENTWALSDARYRDDAIVVGRGHRLDVAFGVTEATSTGSDEAGMSAKARSSPTRVSEADFVK